MQLGKGITFKELNKRIKALPDAPMFSDLQFVENNQLPDNSILVSSYIMRLLKQIFGNQIKSNNMKQQLMASMEEAFQVYEKLGVLDQVPTNPENYACLMFIQSMQHKYLPQPHWKFFGLTINNGAWEVIREV